MKKHISTKDITKIAIMAALVFISTFLIKIPSLNGYTHIGDSMVIISALILGKKKGALAAGLGAALCDLLSGYMQYIIPTFLIKAIMVLIIATIAENLINKYCLVETILYGFAGALASVPANIIQSIVGITLAVVLSTVLEKSNILNKLKTD